MADNLCVDVEAAAGVDDLLCVFGRNVNFQTVTHVEYLVHLGPVGSALFLDGTEQGRNGEHVVLYHAAVVIDEMQHFGLRASGTVDHAVDLGTHEIQQFLDNGRISAGGGKYQFAGSNGSTFYGIIEFVASAVHQFFGHGVVVGLGVLLCKIFAKDVMACAGQSVAAHTAVVLLFIGGLSAAAESHNDIAGANVGVVNDIAALHTAGYSAVHNDGAYQVAHIGGLAASAIDADAHASHFFHQLVGSVDDGADNLTGNEHLVAADGAADKDVVHRTHAEQVIGVHDERVLCDAFPYVQVAGFLPVGIGQTGLCAGAVGMHDIAIFGISA